MELSEKNAKILLLDLHQNIEEYANDVITNIFDAKKFDFISYPPNGGLIQNEIDELQKLENNVNLNNALRKILADNSACVIFGLLSVVDGVAVPKNNDSNWSDVNLVDQEWDGTSEPANDMLHDKFFETYWDWKANRTPTEWSLDNYVNE